MSCAKYRCTPSPAPTPPKLPFGGNGISIFSSDNRDFEMNDRGYGTDDEGVMGVFHQRRTLTHAYV